MNPDTQQFLEDSSQACKNHALIIVEALEKFCYDTPDFTEIDRYLKFAEGSIKKARKIIKNEIEGREVNRKRQTDRLKNS